jgi:hypothetical protein
MSMEKYDIADAYNQMVRGGGQLNESADTEIVHTVASKESLKEHDAIMAAHSEVLKEEYEAGSGSVADMEKLIQIKKIADEKGLDVGAIADFMTAYTGNGEAPVGDDLEGGTDLAVADDLEGSDLGSDLGDDLEGGEDLEGGIADELGDDLEGSDEEGEAPELGPDADEDSEIEEGSSSKWWEAPIEEDEVEFSLDADEDSEIVDEDEYTETYEEDDELQNMSTVQAEDADLDLGDDEEGSDDSEGLDLGGDDEEGSDDEEGLDLGDDEESDDSEPAIVSELRAIETDGTVTDPSTGEEVSVSEADAETYVSVYEYLSDENQAKLAELSIEDAMSLVNSIDLPEDEDEDDSDEDVEGDDEDSDDAEGLDLGGDDEDSDEEDSE